MTFYQFLLDNNVDTRLFEKNCLPEYQGWDWEEDFKYQNIYELFDNEHPIRWIDQAFYWETALQYDEYFWRVLNSEYLVSSITEHGWNPIIIKEL